MPRSSRPIGEILFLYMNTKDSQKRFSSSTKIRLKNTSFRSGFTVSCFKPMSYQKNVPSQKNASRNASFTIKSHVKCFLFASPQWPSASDEMIVGVIVVRRSLRIAETRRSSDLQIEVEREKRRKVEKVLKLLHRYCLLEMLDSCFGSLMNGCALEAGSLLIKNAFR